MIENIKVKPKRVHLSEGKLALGRIFEPRFRVLIASELGMLGEMAKERLIDSLSELFMTDAADAVGSVDIVLKISDIVPFEVTKNIEQGYKLYVDNTSVRIIGFSNLGLYYGVTTFLQALDVCNTTVSIQKMLLIDFPDIRTRGHLIIPSSLHPVMSLDDWSSIIDGLAEYKINQLVIPINVLNNIKKAAKPSQECLAVKNNTDLDSEKAAPLIYSPSLGHWIGIDASEPSFVDDYFDKLIKYAKSHGVEVLPLLSYKGFNITPSVLNDRFDHEIACKTVCVTSERTYDDLFTAFDLLITKYLRSNSIESIHIDFSALPPVEGSKEHSIKWCCCEECRKLSDSDKLINHTVKLLRHLKAYGMTNIYLDSDVLTGLQTKERFIENLERDNLTDVAVFDFRDNAPTDTLSQNSELRSVIKFLPDFSGTAGISELSEKVAYLSALALTSGAEGLLSYLPVGIFYDISCSSVASLSWNCTETKSGDDYQRQYVKCEFSVNYKRIMKLFEDLKVLTEGLFLENDGTSLFSVYSLLNPHGINKQGEDNGASALAFPGNILTELLSHRTEYKNRLSNAISVSAYGFDLFTEIESRGANNSRLASMYALEFCIYRELTASLLALLDIHDLSKSQKLTKAIIKRMTEIASERRRSLAYLLYRLENTDQKHSLYYGPIQISVYMQAFAEIEEHLLTAKGKALRIDLFDLGSIASKLYLKIT